MSSEDSEDRISTSVQGEATYHMVKPVKSVWQYAASKDKEKSIVVDEKSNCAGETSSLPSKRNYSDQDEDTDSDADSSSVNESNDENSKGRIKRKMMEMCVEHISPAPRKSKVVWTNTLHDRFLKAIDILGMDKAVPKKILELMNVPGLSRENIASHLQKYRLFVKRFGNKSDSDKFKSPHKDVLKFNFPPNTLPSSSSSNEHLRLFRLGFGKVPSFLHEENIDFLQSLTQEAQSSSSTLHCLGLERSHPLLGQTSAGIGLSSSDQTQTTTLGLDFPLQGDGHCSKDNLAPLDMCKHMCPSQKNGTKPYLGFNPSTLGCNNSGLALKTRGGVGTMGSSVIHPAGTLSSNPPVSNYVGIRLTNDGELVRGGGGGRGGGGLLQFDNSGINGVMKNNLYGLDMTNWQSMLLASGYDTRLPSMAVGQQFMANQGLNDNFKFNTMNNGSSLSNYNNTYYQQPLGNGDLCGVFNQQVNLPYKNGRDFIQHPNIPNGPCIVDYENNVPQSELLNSRFSNLYNLQGSILHGDTSSIKPGNREQLLDFILPSLNQDSAEQKVPRENTTVNGQASHSNAQEKEEDLEAMLRAVREFLED